MKRTLSLALLRRIVAQRTCKNGAVFGSQRSGVSSGSGTEPRDDVIKIARNLMCS